MKLIFGLMYLHIHNSGQKVYPLIENKHRPHSLLSTDIENKYIRYPLMRFRRIWPPASERKRSSRMKSY